MRTLLLADDTKTTLAVEKSFLEIRNLRVFTTTSAAEVLNLANVLQPDLIVLDYEMPEMNGDQVCRRLKANPNTQQIPVLIISSHDEEQISQACIEAGAVGYMRKTEGRDALLDRVAEVLSMRRREHRRVPCHITASVESEGERLRGLIHSLSAGGLYLTLDRVVAERKALRITFSLPDTGVEISVLGEVVCTETLSGSLHGHGIQLLQADDRSLEELEGFVKRTL